MDKPNFKTEKDAEELAAHFWEMARQILAESNPTSARISQARELLNMCYELKNKPLAWLNQFATRYMWRTI